MKNNFFNKSFTSVTGLTKEDISLVFRTADEMKHLVGETGGDDRLKGKMMAALFYEPSSRTFSSFITAMQRLGGGIIPLNGMSNTSAAKGETLSDTAKVFSQYADVIAIRHSEVGSVSTFAQAAEVPVLNAGDGTGEHPTQALLDGYTVSKHFSDLTQIHVGLVGDLLYGRTVHSLMRVLSLLGVKNFHLISPEQLRMPKDIVKVVRDAGGTVIEEDQLKKSLPDFDMIYMTRVQKERFTDQKEYERLKHIYILDSELMKSAKKTAVVMHPLPRVGEITEDVDADPRALYFREEIKNGMYIRMALLDLILNDN